MEENIITEITDEMPQEELTASEEEILPRFELDLEEDAEVISEELAGIAVDPSSLSENERYAELRELGLTPKEAYLALGIKRDTVDNRSHLSSAMPRSAQAPRGQMSRRELETARSIFSDLDDNELRRLYKRVTK